MLRRCAVTSPRYLPFHTAEGVVLPTEKDDSSGRDRPRVSVVLPTYRRPERLEAAMESVLAQTYADWELLIVDDNGRGTVAQCRTEQVVRRQACDRRVRYVVHDANRGGAAARNTGIDRARGEFVAFLDDDDVWYPAKLALQVACFDGAPGEVAVVYGGYRRFMATGRSDVFTPSADSHSLGRLLRENSIGTTSLVLCRRRALLEIGGFDEELAARQDIDLYVRLAHNHGFASVPDTLLDKIDHHDDAIGKDQAGRLRAYQRFYAKHRSAFDADRRAHHAYVTMYGARMLASGDLAMARRLLWRAWRLDPRAIRSLGLAILARRPLWTHYDGFRRALGWGRPTPSHRSRTSKATKRRSHSTMGTKPEDTLQT